MVGFAYLFGLANTWAHGLMVASLAGVIALVLFTIGVMDHPFSGGARIEPGASSWCSTGSIQASSATSDNPPWDYSDGALRLAPPNLFIGDLLNVRS